MRAQKATWLAGSVVAALSLSLGLWGFFFYRGGGCYLLCLWAPCDSSLTVTGTLKAGSYPQQCQLKLIDPERPTEFERVEVVREEVNVTFSLSRCRKQYQVRLSCPGYQQYTVTPFDPSSLQNGRLELGDVVLTPNAPGRRQTS